MKKTWNVAVVLVIFGLMAGFSSCKKDEKGEGIYNPKEKISNLVLDYSYGEGDHQESQVSEQTWIWDDDKLSQIKTSYENFSYTTDFKYDGKRISEITSMAGDYTFYYDGDKLEKIILTFDLDEDYSMTIYVQERDGGKITKMRYETTMSYWEKIKSGDREARRTLDMLRLVVSDDFAKKIQKDAATRVMKKSADSYSYYTDVEIKYSGDNVVEQRWIYSPDDVEIVKFKYDGKKNPHYGALWYYAGEEGTVMAISENNLTSMTYYEEGYPEEAEETVYEYTYSGDWPITRSYSWEEIDEEGNLVYYEGEKITYTYK